MQTFPNNSIKPVRVGLAGAGYVSTYHARALKGLPHVQIVGIADPDRTRASQVAEQFGIPGVYASLAEMASAKPDVVHILTPPSSHCQLTLEALRMGCHVFVEKPMADTPEECDQMIAAAKVAGRILSVNHSARMDPIVLKALDLVRHGACGDILGVDFFRGSDYPPYAGGPVPAPYRVGAYPFQDLGVHGLYLLETFLGKILNLDVRYSSSGRDPHLLFDEWRALAACEKGSGQMYISWSARPMRNELIIQGTRGVIHVDCFLQTCVVRKKLPAPRFIGLVAGTLSEAASTLVKVPWNVLQFATGKLLPSPGIHASVLAFYESLAGGTPPPVSAEEGRRIVAWMQQVSREANAEKDRRLEAAVPVPRARILVTGATGFLGRVLLKRLRLRGEPVRVLVRRPLESLSQDPLIHQVCGDLGDPAAVDRAVTGVEVVYHVGAAMRGGKADFESGTVWGTRNIVAACLRHSVKKLVYVSSLTVLDHASHRAGERVTEASPLEPKAQARGFYTQTKLEAERIVLDAVRQQGLPAVILRPGQIFGAGAEKVAPSGTIAIAGRWVVVGGGNLRLPLVYVEDVVDALLLAEEGNHLSGSIFHLVDPAVVTQNEYLELCRKVPGNTLRIWRVPKWLLLGASIGVEVLCGLLHRAAPVSRYRLRSARPLGPCDCSAAVEKLGWDLRTGVRAGLKAVFEPRREEAGGALAPPHVAPMAVGREDLQAQR
jgi:2-alkyl-3-oxoalkanoate reductase